MGIQDWDEDGYERRGGRGPGHGAGKLGVRARLRQWGQGRGGYTPRGERLPGCALPDADAPVSIVRGGGSADRIRMRIIALGVAGWHAPCP